MLLVGEGNVGKSSLVAALKGDDFVEGRPTTHGIEISPVEFRHPHRYLHMTLRAWDFGGQEVYRISHQFFFSPRALYLVVWHARQGHERDEVEGWLRRIKLRVRDQAVAMVVATHCAERLPDLDYPDMERRFHGMLVGSFEIDSSTGAGIDGLRAAISERAANLPQMGQRISPRWTAAREAVLALAETKPQIWYEMFAEICVLRLMEKFDISYRLDGDESQSLVPQLVPHQRPALPWQFGDTPPTGLRTLSLTCRLAEPAPGLIPWLTARHHWESTGAHWRRGVFLRHPIRAYESEALVQLVRDDELSLEVRAPSPDLYFNVLRDSIEHLIRQRWPGLGYRLYIPCSGNLMNGDSCPGKFPLDGLLLARQSGDTTIRCMDCGVQSDIPALLTGFTTPDQPVATEVEQMHHKVADIATSVDGLVRQASEIADTVRRVNRVVSTEVTNCPRLFTLGRKRPGLLDRVRLHQEHYQLTLWCEHPGFEHAWSAATYELDPPREWFVQIAPYARLVFRTLQLIVPVAAAIDVASLPSTQRDNPQARLDVMQAIVDDLPVDALVTADREFSDRDGGSGKLTQAEGQALRAIREIVFEKDPLHAFGDMRRVQSPAGDLLWVCPVHYPDYDPGLPTLP
jgi:hypothetical protein